ncbi:hypothetical protein VCRA2119O147_1230006 [Vibrio crassostreae]|nr:hypothetical protein VCRA2117O376_100080 [Vibrio crassostreae]CAK1700352.1 hypothetical protein VCRA2113O358_100080 [Vibrio crassostreae]CAK1701044.1 hypothetical protein VCRA2113O354_100102 [Vibrio crassostreae]CAK1702872.1 hypothetical protein VCRA2113O199_100107 [Vibrio crassostreae]CAK1703659.1 hypothetical protein VCRA2115O371_100114 [Vibrio crassostreae]
MSEKVTLSIFTQQTIVQSELLCEGSLFESQFTEIRLCYKKG